MKDFFPGDHVNIYCHYIILLKHYFLWHIENNIWFYRRDEKTIRIERLKKKVMEKDQKKNLLTKDRAKRDKMMIKKENFEKI